jgi:hypothetical protein
MEDVTLAVTMATSVAICFGVRSIKERYLEVYKQSGLSSYVFLIYLISWVWVLGDTLNFSRISPTLSIDLLYVPFAEGVAILATALMNSWVLNRTKNIMRKLKELEPQIKRISKEIDSSDNVCKVIKRSKKKD